MDEAFIDAFCELQGAHIADTTLLQAMVMTHPDPYALLRAWNALSAPRVASVAQRKALSEFHEKTAESALHHFQQWTARLEAAIPSA
ncbi:hypothetical protein [Lysobacter fragariae]